MPTKPVWLGGVAPEPGWALLAHLVPADDDVVPQYAGLGASGAWYLTQGRDTDAAGTNSNDDLLITKFDPQERRVGTLTIPRGGHGDRLVMAGDLCGVYVRGVWCWVPWRSGTMTVAQAQTFSGTRRRCQLPARVGCQGEADLGWLWLRLYGQSIKGGAERDWTHATATLEVIEGLTVLRTVDLDSLARDAKGLPVGGRYEPEGISVATLNDEPWVLVSFAVGRIGATTMNVYGRPLGYLLNTV